MRLRRQSPGRPAATARRAILAALPLLAASPVSAAPASGDEWQAFKRRFLLPEGRLIDSGNEGVSHSEGQGWGLMFAAAFDDRPAFDRILGWTRRVLKRRTDNLHAWRFRPGAPHPVEDQNNATDGDLYIAYGLLTAHARWRHAPYRQLALTIAQDVLRVTLRRPHGRPVLLPGASGFESPAGTVLNPSYFVLPIFATLDGDMPGAGWRQVAAEAIELMRRGRFGAWGLNPDWLLLPPAADAPLQMPPTWPPRFSFDAVRAPLALAWAGDVTHPALLGAHAFWSDQRWTVPPAWVDLVTGNTAEFQASPGMRAIASFVAARIAGRGATVALPSVNASDDYYSASLTLLVRIACLSTGAQLA